MTGFVAPLCIGLRSWRNDLLNPSNIKIERAEPGDCDELTKLAFRSKAHWGYDKKLLDAWRDELSVSESMISEFISYKAEKDGKIIGFWCREPKEELSEGRLFVDPDSIGTGVGKLLWTAVMNEARSLGLRFLTWEADPNAEAFYKKMGAIKIEEKESPVVPGRMLPIMRCNLVAMGSNDSEE